MALTPAGMPGAIAPPAPGRTPTTRELVDEHGRRSGYQSLRRELLDAIYERKSFRQVLRDLNLTPNRVWG
jgi:hypothetical protein